MAIGANIPLKLLIRECSLKKKSDEEIFNDLKEMNRENIHEIFKYKKFNYDFSDYVTIYSSEEDIIGSIEPSYDEFFYSLLRFLNIKDIDTSNSDNTTIKMKEKIEELKQITEETELKNKFPILFNDLIQGREYIRKAKTQEEKDYYYSCALKKSLDNFIKTQVELYTRFIEKRASYGELIAKKNYNEYFKENFNMDKVRMILASKYLNICRSSDDFITISKYFEVLDSYDKSKSYEKGYTLKDENNEELRAYQLELGVINLRLRYNELRKLDANWEIIPPDSYHKVRKGSKPRVTLLNYEEMNRLRDIGEEKKSFYIKTKPLLIIKGKNRYKDYLAYVYKNGETILDREYDSDNPNTATGAAIFNFRIGDFETLSKLTPSVLKKNKKAKRIEHRSDWKEKVLEIINKEITKDDQEEINKFLTKRKGK